MKIIEQVRNFYRNIKMLTSDERMAIYFGPDGIGGASASGEVVTAQTAMQQATVYACVRVASETLGSLPCIVYENLEGGGRRRVPDHPLWKVLHDEPNEFQTAMEFYEMMQAAIELRGNAYAFQVRVRGVLKELLPIQPDRVRVEQLDNYRVVYHITGNNGQQGTYSQKEILHVKFLSQNGYVGLTPIAAQRDTIGTARGQDKFGAVTFKNAARPSGVLSVPGALTDKSYKRLKEDWDANYSGENTGKSAILEGGSTWQQLGMNSDDAQYLESKKFSRSEIAAIFRIPPHKVGDLEKATFSNIEQQSLEFVTDSMVPRAERWEQRFAKQLVDEPNIHVEFLMAGLLRGDSKARMLFYKDGITHGILNPNEARIAENLEPYAGGEKYVPAENIFGKQKNSNQGTKEDDDEKND